MIYEISYVKYGSNDDMKKLMDVSSYDEAKTIKSVLKRIKNIKSITVTAKQSLLMLEKYKYDENEVELLIKNITEDVEKLKTRI